MLQKLPKNHYFTYTNGIEYGSIILNLAFTKAKDGEPVYYIYNIGDNKGFVIVSAEDNVYPILGYSFEGSFTSQPGFEPANFNYWMDNCSDQILYVRENTLPADELIESTWNSLLVSDPVSKDFDNVDPCCRHFGIRVHTTTNYARPIRVVPEATYGQVVLQRPWLRL